MPKHGLAQGKRVRWKRQATPVRPELQLFHSPHLVSLPTATTLQKGDFEFEISHRFIPTLNSGYSSLYGLDGPVNMRIALGYAPTNRMVITLGRRGYLGLFSVTASMILPMLLFVLKCPTRLWGRPEYAPTAVLALIPLLFMIDCMLNAMVNPLYILFAGGVTGMLALHGAALFEKGGLSESMSPAREQPREASAPNDKLPDKLTDIPESAKIKSIKIPLPRMQFGANKSARTFSPVFFQSYGAVPARQLTGDFDSDETVMKHDLPGTAPESEKIKPALTPVSKNRLRFI